MGKSAKWLKTVFRKKTSKSSSSKAKESGKEVVVTTKVEESDVVSDLPSFAVTPTDTVDRSGGMLEAQNVEPEDISDDEIEVHEGKPTDAQNVVPVQDNVVSDAERIQQEIAATSVQAAFRGYLARRAFWALKGIIRLQALIRGHLVRRQAVATLFSVMGIVRLQAFARGREIRKSDISLQVHRKCRLQLLQGNKLANPTDAYLGIKKLTSNAFALKLLASSPKVMPVRAYDSSNPNSNLIWLENWSASCFWKPVPQPKKIGRKSLNKSLVEAESAKPKKSPRKVAATNSGSSAVQTSFEFEKSKRSFRKVSSQSIEPPAVEDPQIELEKVKRSLRKVHNPVVESSIQPQRSPRKEVEKPKLDTEKITESSYLPVHKTEEEIVNVCDEKKTCEMPEQPEEEVHLPEVLEADVHTPGPLETNEALDSSLYNQIDSNERAIAEEKPSMKKDIKEERTPKPNSKDNSAGKENQKSRKKGSATTKTEHEESNGHSHTSPSIPSYMQATKSAKAKSRLQGSPMSAEQDATEKANVPRRYSLPSSGRITSNSPRTTRLTNSGDKTGNKKAKPLLSSREAKTSPAERKR